MDSAQVTAQIPAILNRAIALLPIGAKARVSRKLAEQMASSPWFTPSTGWPWVGAQHFRAPLTDGGCLHLVIYPRSATIHRDRFNPDQDLDSFVNHLIFDAPVHTALTIGAAATLRWATR